MYLYMMKIFWGEQLKNSDRFCENPDTAFLEKNGHL